MVAALPQPDGARVTAHDGAVYIDGFIETDPDVVAAVTEADDAAAAVAAVHERLALGGRVLRIAQARLDGDVIRTEVDRLTATFTGAVTTAVSDITTTSAQLLDPETGQLPTALSSFRDEVESLIGEA